MKKFYYKTILEREVFFNGWEIFNSNFERMIKENKAMLLCKWGLFNMCCRCNVCIRSDNIQRFE